MANAEFKTKNGIIANGTITAYSDLIANGTLYLTVGSDAEGDLYTRASNGALIRIAKGANNTVLGTNSTGGFSYQTVDGSQLANDVIEGRHINATSQFPITNIGGSSNLYVYSDLFVVNSHLTLDSTGAGYFHIKTPDASSGYVLFGDTVANAGQIIYHHSNNALRVLVSSTEKLHINSTAVQSTVNVAVTGTGTFSGNITSSGDMITLNATSNPFLHLKGPNTGVGYIFFGDTEANAGQIQYHHSNNTMKMQVSGDRLAINTTAVSTTVNVAVTGGGTFTANVDANHLTANHNIYAGQSIDGIAQMYLTTNTTGVGYVLFANSTDNPGRVQYHHTNSHMSIWAGNAQRLSVNSTGIGVTGSIVATTNVTSGDSLLASNNVYLGTVNDTDTRVTLTTNSTGVGYVLFSNSTVNPGRVQYHHTNSHMAIYAGNAQRLGINSTGIGVTGILDVSGTVTFDGEMNVNNNINMGSTTDTDVRLTMTANGTSGVQYIDFANNGGRAGFLRHRNSQEDFAVYTNSSQAAWVANTTTNYFYPQTIRLQNTTPAIQMGVTGNRFDLNYFTANDTVKMWVGPTELISGNNAGIQTMTYGNTSLIPAWEFIEEFNLSGSAHVDSNTGWSNYDAIKIYMFNLVSSANGTHLGLRQWYGATLHTASYRYTIMEANNTIVSANGSTSAGRIELATNVSNAVHYGVNGELTLVQDPTTVGVKTIMFHTAYSPNNAFAQVLTRTGAGAYPTASTCSGVRIYFGTGTMTGRVRVYGQKIIT